jgi:anaerobic selenocysteine-containing dehydrogenase
LCAQNCGLEVLVEKGRMEKVRPDKANPRSRGYACRKGLNVLYHQYPADRLTRALKRVGDDYQPVSREQALDEIAARLQTLLVKHGPRCLAYSGPTRRSFFNCEAPWWLRRTSAWKHPRSSPVWPTAWA